MQKHICIVGSGTAGLVTAIITRGFFPSYKITVVSSSEIGIIGVGEGSTEHWRQYFTDPHNIDVNQMVRACAATHKYGIRFENWTNHTPDYFHSVSQGGFGPNDYYSNYAFCLENGWPLTAAANSDHLWENKVIEMEDPLQQHYTTNQFHFDTFKLNNYLKHVSAERNIALHEGIVEKIERNPENGFITSISTDTGLNIAADFYIDATGFKRVLMSQLVEDDAFISYRDYLPTDSAAVFPTPPDESGEIRPYTRARALANGWVFEIPTQERRGNGYIFASDFCSDDQAVKELSEAYGREITPARIIRYKSGYFKHSFEFNCASVGLASSFVEPLEATSISTSIQQARMICAVLPTFGPSSVKQVEHYRKTFDSLMDNILTMISLHYISDRDDSDMWVAQKNAKLPDTLSHLLELWKERIPLDTDVPKFGYELFYTPHLWHVAQGQGVLSKETASMGLDAYQSREPIIKHYTSARLMAIQRKRVPHASIFKHPK